MATNRFSYLDDFTLKDKKVGINSSTPSEKLDVDGSIGVTNFEQSGIATFSAYESYLTSDQNIKGNRVVNTSTVSSSISSKISIGIGDTLSISEGTTIGQGNIESLKVTNTFTPPIGGINDRPTAPKPGALFYNKDFRTIEYWDGNFWRQVDNTTTSGRGYFAGGRSPAPGSIADTKKIDIVQISSLGNAINFGELTNTRRNHASCSSSIRGLCISGSYNGSASTDIEYFTLSSEGIGVDFGAATQDDQGESALASSTRGVHATGNPSNKKMDYVEIATTGNAIEFGERVISLDEHGAISSATRGLFCGGGAPSGSAPNATMQLITIASKGDATTFGDLTQTRGQLGGGVSNGVRGIVAGGFGTPVNKKGIDYITFASEGNATHFGDLMVGRSEQAGAASNRTRGVFAGGYSGGYLNSIEYITMSTIGNAQDFGDLTDQTERIGGGQISDSHGGLGGY